MTRELRCMSAHEPLNHISYLHNTLIKIPLMFIGLSLHTNWQLDWLINLWSARGTTQYKSWQKKNGKTHHKITHEIRFSSVSIPKMFLTLMHQSYLNKYSRSYSENCVSCQTLELISGGVIKVIDWETCTCRVVKRWEFWIVKSKQRWKLPYLFISLKGRITRSRK